MTDATSDVNDQARSSDQQWGCRLCDAATVPKFKRIVLARYEVHFVECPACQSLQTEPPYWLDESYADGRRPLDTNAVQRVERLRLLVFFMLRHLGMLQSYKVIDWGGGDGLFVRMLRDVGIDAWHFDPFAVNSYAIGFDGDASRHYDMVTAFEVWEHLVDPIDELNKIFELAPEFHFATTSIYRRGKHDDQWSYLNTDTGRHVFFYSATAAEQIAAKYGYQVQIYANKYLLFSKHPLAPRTQRYFTKLFSMRRQRWFNLQYACLRKNSLSERDKAQVTELVKRGALGRNP